MPMTECCVISNANSTPAADIFAPPAPKKCASGNWLRKAETSSAASKSPLASPAMSMKVFRFTGLFSRSDAKARRNSANASLPFQPRSGAR